MEKLIITPGVSNRSEFSLIRSKTALLVIDVQDHLSSEKHVHAGDESCTGSYFFDVGLPIAIPNIAKLLKTIRSIRDSGRSHESALSPTSGNDENTANANNDRSGCEVIITFLQSQTPDCRDISLDYKLSGPKLTKLPNPSNEATFSCLPPELTPSRAGKGDIALPKTSCSVFQSTNLHYILNNLQIRQLVVCGQLTDQCVMSAVRDAADLGYLVNVVKDACAALTVEDHQRGLLGMQGFARIVSTQEVLNELEEDDVGEVTVEVTETEGNSGPPEEKVALNQIATHGDGMDQQARSSLKSISPASIWKPPFDSQQSGAIQALLHALQIANVKFLRFASIDVSNSIRTKMVPIQRLAKGSQVTKYPLTVLDNQVTIAKVCMAGLPSYGDFMIPETNIDAKDVLIVRPDLKSLRVLPYAKSSAMVFGTLHDQRTGELSSLCTRGLLARVIKTADSRFGIGFTVGAEIEFCLVHYNDKVVSDAGMIQSMDPVDTSLFAGATTLNDQEKFISDLNEYLEKQDIEVEMIHAESAPGQMEIVLPYELDVMELADKVVLAKETIKACAKQHGLRALFSPKVYGDQAGNGMHVHLSLRNVERNAFSSSNIFPSGSTISNTGMSFMEGILSHLKALTAFTIPSPNSFARVGKGCWTGYRVGWDIEDKESPLRVCLDARDGKATNVELKLMDNTCNIYLALGSILWAGLDGIAEGMAIRPAMGRSIDVAPDMLPSNLRESLDQLIQDNLFKSLLGEDLMRAYVAVKRAEIENSAGSSIEHQRQIANDCRK